MNPKERYYFEKKKNYLPRVLSNHLKIQEDITNLSQKIRETANYALLEEISPNEGKKEISNLIKTINKLKKEFN